MLRKIDDEVINKFLAHFCYDWTFIGFAGSSSDPMKNFIAADDFSLELSMYTYLNMSPRA